MSDKYYFRLLDKSSMFRICDDVVAKTGAEARRLLEAAGFKMNPEIHKLYRLSKASYGWMITRDHLNEDSHHPENESSEVGVMGPRNIDPELAEFFEEYKKQLLDKKTPLPRKPDQKTFKMYDDDGILYYTGISVGVENGREPLDDYGTPNAGCTSIKYPRFPDFNDGL